MKKEYTTKDEVSQDVAAIQAECQSLQTQVNAAVDTINRIANRLRDALRRIAVLERECVRLDTEVKEIKRRG